MHNNPYEEMYGIRSGRVLQTGASVSAELGYTTVLALVHPPTEALRNPKLKDFMEFSWHRHDWVNHWPLVLNSNSSPSSLPRDGEGMESSNLLMMPSLSGDLIPSWSYLGALSTHKATNTLKTHHSGNPKVFRSLSQESDTKLKYIFSVVPQRWVIVTWETQTRDW